MILSEAELLEEFHKQVNTLISKKYPKFIGIPDEKFLELFKDLEESVKTLKVEHANLEEGYLPFILVTKNTLITTNVAVSLIERENKPGITKLYPREPDDFSPIQSVLIPENLVYLIVDVDRGKQSLNVRPQDALQTIVAQERSPLTIDEGVAIVTHYPNFLIKNNCFSLLASRNPNDKRVPAIWINGEKHPNLGWCWDGNPHTWLGSASCKTRI